jgi:hypothetical protein
VRRLWLIAALGAGCSPSANTGDGGPEVDLAAPDLGVPADLAAPADRAGRDLTQLPDLRTCDGAGLTELCDNLTDDDCDGLVDCADPDCAAFACIDLPDPDWSVVAYEEGQQAVCPAGWIGAQSLYTPAVVNAPPANCSCGCQTLMPAQCAGTVVVHHRGVGCPGNIDQASVYPANNGACSPTVANVIDGDGYSLTSMVSAMPATCNGVPTQSKTPVSAPPIVSCSPITLGAGCKTGLCAPVRAGSFAVCLAHDGDVPCPAAFPNHLLRYAGYADSRSCTGDCTCGSTLACNAVGFTFFQQANCATLPFSFGTACNVSLLMGGAKSSYAVAFGNSGTASCVVKASTRMPTGGVTVSPGDARTICCR